MLEGYKKRGTKRGQPKKPHSLNWSQIAPRATTAFPMSEKEKDGPDDYGGGRKESKPYRSEFHESTYCLFRRRHEKKGEEEK